MGSRSWRHQNASTLSGSEAPSLPLSPPSNRCGSRSKNTMSLAQVSSTASASKQCGTNCVASLLTRLLLANLSLFSASLNECLSCHDAHVMSYLNAIHQSSFTSFTATNPL